MYKSRRAHDLINSRLLLPDDHTHTHTDSNMQLQVILAMCLVGLVAATSPLERRQMTTAEMIEAIHDLRKEVASIRETVGKMRSIGRSLITKLDT